MAEENKPQQEVDIDTDGVNEEIINVDKPIEPNEAFSKKEDVDLGYTNPIQETKVEAEPEVELEEEDDFDSFMKAMSCNSEPVE